MRSNRMTAGTVPKWVLIIPMIFVITGIVMGAVNIHLKNQNDIFMKTAIPVEATCTRIWTTVSTDDDGDETVSYHADIAYEYQGITYRANDFSVTSSEQKGSTITVYINPGTPEDARQEYGNMEFIFALCFSGVFTVIGLFVFVTLLKASRKPKIKVNEPWEM